MTLPNPYSRIIHEDNKVCGNFVPGKPSTQAPPDSRKQCLLLVYDTETLVSSIPIQLNQVSTVSVLVLEDSPSMQSLMSSLLETVSGVGAVVSFGDVPSALSWCHENQPHLVIVDQILIGQETGLDFIQKFRRMPSGLRTPVLMITQVVDRDLRYRALEAGANDFLTKPLDQIEFIARTRNMLALSGMQSQQQKVDAANRDLRAALELAVEGIAQIDADGRCTTVNQAFSRMVGYPTAEILGRNWQSFVHPSDIANLQGAFLTMQRTGKVAVEVQALRKSGGTLDLELVLLPHWVDGRLDGFFCFARDISHRKHLERMKSEFISVVSHELRTPLTSIHGALGLLQGGIAGTFGEQAQNLLSVAGRNAERLLSLVNDILDLDKLVAGKMHFQLREFDLFEATHQAVETNRQYADRFGVTFGLRPCPGPCLGIADSDRLQQVLANLLSNAAKFSPKEGQVDIEVSVREHHIRIAVTDQGPGIRPEFRARIFEKFSQADTSTTRHKGGTGLGLAIAKGMVERMGGLIGFVSEPNIRTTFYIELPRKK